jgi:hypothetical protein
MPFDLYNGILRILQQRFPLVAIHSFLQKPPTPASIPLRNVANFYDYVVVNRQRFVASSRRAGLSGDSLVIVKTGDTTHVGELCDIFVIQTEVTGVERMGRMRWFRPLSLPGVDRAWLQL